MQASISTTRSAAVALIAAIALMMSALLAAPAAEARQEGPTKGSCVQAGLGTLKDLDLFRDAAQNPAKKQLDYSTLADPVKGPIFAELPEGSFLSLGQVVKLHTSSPELFAWCR